MAGDARGVWWVLVEYKWIVLGVGLLIALSQGWVDVPILNTVLGGVVEILKAAVPG